MDSQAHLSKYRLGWVISLVVCFLPLILWYGAHDFNYFFGSNESVYRLLAKTSAMLGSAMFAWALILSARPRFLEKMFNGLDKMYGIHRYLGTVSLGLLLLHPLFLTFRFSSNWPKLWLSNSVSFNLGIAALASMLAIIIFTVFVRLKHQYFVAIHGLLGIVFGLGIIHASLTNAEMATNLPLRWYMLGLSLVALGMHLYFTMLGGLWALRYKYKVAKVRQKNDSITEVELERLSQRPLLFVPGQFVFVRFFQSGLDDEAHPYSIASGNREENLRLLIKGLGDHTAAVSKLKIGTKVVVEGAYGQFSYKNVSKARQVWVAGGIGITPFLSMAKSLRTRRYKIDLYYCTKTAAEALGLEELRAASKRYPNFTVHLHAEDCDGFISIDTIIRSSGSVIGKELLLCGPPPMMNNLKRQAVENGLAEYNINFEEFAI